MFTTKNEKAKVILVGGFLGAGKTTMLYKMAELLKDVDQIGLITNDQATELVDTAVLSHIVTNTKEVSGSCFCCNFPGFEEALSDLKNNAKVDVIIAEPVGSCTDLSATILQPIKDKYAESYELAPFSVLVDPKRLAEILDGKYAGLHPSAAYIVRKQLEEADYIVVNKVDLIEAGLQDDEGNVVTKEALTEKVAKAYPQAKLFFASAATGEGVSEWMEALSQDGESGKTLTEVDYDTYAEGEAVLGWLNAGVTLTGATDWNAFVDDYMKALAARFSELEAPIGHLKVRGNTASGAESGEAIIANLTGGGHPLNIRGEVGQDDSLQLIVNARVQMSPEDLQKEVFAVLEGLCGDAITMETGRVECLMPGRPNPTYHYEEVC